MKKYIIKSLLIFLSTPIFYAHANEIKEIYAEVDHRCEQDNLDIPSAIGRNDWSLQCNHITAKRYDILMNDDEGNPRPRPMYTVFLSSEENPRVWRAPVTAADTYCYNEAVKQFNRRIYCTASCYTPDQVILFNEGNVPIGEAFKEKLQGVMGMKQGSTIENIEFQALNVKSYTESITDTLHTIVHFYTENGGEIKVTTNHPLVNGDGYLKEAERFRVGDKLIKENGSATKIVKIIQEPYFGKVYNIKPNSKFLENHIVVAQGFLSGSSYFQNDGINYLDGYHSERI